MKRLPFIVSIAALCLPCAHGETLVDFSKDGEGCYLMCSKFQDDREPRQIECGPDGLTVRFDSSREKPHGWATLAIPAVVGRRIDWNGRHIAVVMKGVPKGRVARSGQIDFTDEGGEIFQMYPMTSTVDDEGNLRIVFRVDIALRPSWCKSWGKNVNNRVDGKLRLSSFDISFVSREGLGEITLARIDEIEASKEVRDVVSHEPISTDTSYPGAAPFPGAENVAFEIKPAFDGTATLTLSTESAGSARQGRMVKFEAAVSNGVARFATDLPYEGQYEFYQLDCKPAAGSTVKGPFKPVRAGGRFLQTAAEAMRLDVDTKNDLHICRDARERPELVVRNPSRSALRWKTTFVGSDFFGHTFSVPFDRTFRAGEEVRVALPWPLPAKGFWRVKATVEGEDGSKAKKETTFAFIDRHEATPPMDRSKFRFGIHYHGTQYMPGHVDRTIAAMVACGVKFVRTDYDFMFGAVERPQGTYHWEKADFMLKKLRDAGMSLDIIVGGTPGWAWDETANWAKTKPTRRTGVRPSRPGLFRDYCEQIARRYGTEIEYYEPGNEWDFSPAAVITADEALRMQREAYEGVHAGCPAALVSTPGWAHVATADLEGGPDHVNKGLVEAMAQHPEWFDIWALHGHGSTSAYCRQIDDIFLPLKAANPMAKRPWMSNETSQTGAYGEEVTVTRTVWQKMLFAWSRGSKDFIWYNLRATGWFDGHEPGFGLVTPDYHPRASYAAYAAVTAIFSGLDFDGAIYSRKMRHILRFKGAKPGFAGIVVAAWDEGATPEAIRRVRLRSDAKRVWKADLMDNRTMVVPKDGIVEIGPEANPQAWLFEGATRVDAVDAAELPAAVVPVKTISCRDTKRAPDFTLTELKNVKDFYAANPLTTDRLWKGPQDHSARIWLDRMPTGELKVRAEVEDDVRAAGDGFEALIGVSGAAAESFAVRWTGREGTVDRYESVLPVTARQFDFDVRIHEDDGDGVDGYLRLVNDSEDPLRVIVTAD